MDRGAVSEVPLAVVSGGLQMASPSSDVFSADWTRGGRVLWLSQRELKRPQRMSAHIRRLR